MGSIRSRRALLLAGTLVASLSLAAVAFVGSAGSAGSGPGDGGVVLASAPVVPDGTMGRDSAVLVTNRRSMRRTWREYQMPGRPTRVMFGRRYVLFVSNGESSSCPEEFKSLERVVGRKRVKVEVHHAWGPGCTDDWGPRSFVLGAARERFPKGSFEVRIDFGRWVTVKRR